ncbi:TIGR02285 family protein [Rheinheimera sp.]|uniref:TIGR02285 family protein n=1 Tax=Rheinheimera sp. TaxID=1869214 RepID=UPI00307F8E31
MARLCCLLICCSLPFSAAAKDQLNWAINAAPPFHITEGPLKQRGLCDALVRSVRRQLPDIAQPQQIIPQPRIHQLLNEDQQLCFPCMIHQDKATKTAVFTKPTHYYPPQGILTRKALADFLRQQFGSPVSLAAVLKSNSFKLGLAAGRRYGSLQPLLEQYAQDPWIRSGDGSMVALLQMIQSGKLDYSLDYPMVLRYLQQTAPQMAQGLVYLPIAELRQPVAGAIGCANSEWGQQKVRLINQVLQKVKQDPDFTEAQKLWLAPSAPTAAIEH